MATSNVTAKPPLGADEFRMWFAAKAAQLADVSRGLGAIVESGGGAPSPDQAGAVGDDEYRALISTCEEIVASCSALLEATGAVAPNTSDAALRRTWDANPANGQGVRLQSEFRDIETFVAFSRNAPNVTVLERRHAAPAALRRDVVDDESEFDTIVVRGAGAGKVARSMLVPLRTLFRRDRARFNETIAALGLIGSRAVTSVDDVTTAALSTDWDSSAALRREFGNDKESYFAFKRHEGDVSFAGMK